MGQVRLGNNLIRVMQRVEDRTRLIVTPRYEKFLEDNPEVIYDRSVIDAVTRSLFKRQTSRVGRLGASSAGQCLRAQVLTYLGAPGAEIEPELRKIFEDGKWRHMRLQAALLQAGIIDRVEVPVKWKRARASGDIDGAGIVPDDHPNPAWRGLEFGLEIKGAMSFAYSHIEKLGPERYYEQIARYFLYAGFDLFVIIIESKDTQAMQEFVVTEKDVNTGRQLHELAVLNDYIERQQLPPMLEPCALARGPQFKSCGYGQSPYGACHQHPGTWT
jgi:hypothetical protein